MHSGIDDNVMALALALALVLALDKCLENPIRQIYKNLDSGFLTFIFLITFAVISAYLFSNK